MTIDCEDCAHSCWTGPYEGCLHLICTWDGKRLLQSKEDYDRVVEAVTNVRREVGRHIDMHIACEGDDNDTA